MKSRYFLLFFVFLSLGNLYYLMGEPPLLEEPFADLSQWETTGDWGLSSGEAFTPPYSASDSPGGPYQNNQDTALTLAEDLDLSELSGPVFLFHQFYALEEGYDFGRVEISLDAGASWDPEPLAVFTGTQIRWHPIQLDLTPWSEETSVRIRFRLITDESVTMEGWSIDQVVVGEAPVPPALPEPDDAHIRQNQVHFDNLSFSSEHRYRLYRSLGSAFDKNQAVRVAEATDPNLNELTDYSVTPKRTYTYQLLRQNTYGLFSWSAPVTVTTPSGTDFPFLDQGEAGSGLWVATPPWALTDEKARSGNYAWADSPYGNYEDGIASLPLTLVEPVDLRSSTHPVLTFYHQYEFASGDSGHVEISTDEGGNWDTLRSFVTGSVEDWQIERISLAGFVDENSVLLRFRLTSDDSENAAGWYIDDISLAEAPDTIPAPALDQIESHQIRLQWNPTSSSWFSHYAIHRDTEASVDYHSPLIATIYDPQTTSFTDEGLLMDTVYHYRVYAVSIFGTYSDSSETSSHARTLNNPLPFFDDFSEENLSWHFTGLWARTDQDSYSGSWSLTDSPGQMHAINTSSHATTAVDLTETIRPVLAFQQHYQLGNGDSVSIALSRNGTSWDTVYSASDSATDWHLNQLDLSEYRGEPNLRIRFEISANWDEDVGYGWFIDEVSVQEHSNDPIPLPVHDDFSDGTGQWITGGWTVREDQSAQSGYAMADTPNDWIGDADQFLTYAQPIDLTGAADPQLVFWYQGTWGGRVYFHLEVSKDGGLSWDSERILGGTSSTTVADWTRFQHSLASYVGETILVRLKTYTTQSSRTQTGRVDAFTIQERPADITQHSLQPEVRAMNLSWSESGLGDDFARYEVYRSTSSGVSVADTLVASIDDAETTSFTDTELAVGQ
ncbi:MAG: hypothetical protein LAT55_12170, partial [Opitutales bacterium]|nr:hypothetical protein [Opitutales bacterium]